MNGLFAHAPVGDRVAFMSSSKVRFSDFEAMSKARALISLYEKLAAMTSLWLTLNLREGSRSWIDESHCWSEALCVDVQTPVSVHSQSRWA